MALARKGNLADMHGKLAGARAHQVAANADVIAEVEQLVESEVVLADVVLADVDLEALAALLELSESGLALDPDGHDAACDRDFFALSLKLFAAYGRGGGVVLRLDPGDDRSLEFGPVLGAGYEGVGVDRVAKCSNLLELLFTLLKKLLLKFGVVEGQGISFCG